LVEQQKIDIAEESTTAGNMKKETKQQRHSSDNKEQDNATGVEIEELKEKKKK
jgi:hypothetical protein